MDAANAMTIDRSSAPLEGAREAIRDRGRPIAVAGDQAPGPDSLAAKVVRLEKALLNAQDLLRVALHERDVARDINLNLQLQLRRAQAKAARAIYRADHDALTGLPNRHVLFERLRQALRDARQRQQTSGVIAIDLDGFKRVNDRFGHAAGDRLLVHVASTLRTVIRTQDTACRVGGDEFVVVLPGIGGWEQLGDVADRIRTRLRMARSLEGATVLVAASVGMATCPAHGSTPEALLERADRNMYETRARVRLSRAGPSHHESAAPANGQDIDSTPHISGQRRR